MEHKHEPIEEVEDFFRALEEKTKKYQKYFEVLEFFLNQLPQTQILLSTETHPSPVRNV